MTKVYTGTMNLAIDLFIETERMLASKVNRTLSDDVQANGKGGQCFLYHEAGANFNGVLCGRAIWAGCVQFYIEKGEEAARDWLRTEGFRNIDELNKVPKKTASSWEDKIC